MKPYLRYIFKSIVGQKKRFVFLTVLIVLNVLFRIVQPYLYKLLVDLLTFGLVNNNFSEQMLGDIVVIIVVWFLFSVGGNVANAQSSYLSWYIGNVVSQIVHKEGFKKLLRLDYHTHTKKHSSQYTKIVDDADTSIWEMSNWWMSRFFPSILGFAAMLVLAFSVSVPMTLISIAVIPVGFLIMFSMMKKHENVQVRINKLWTEKHEKMADQITNIATYKLNQDEDYFLKRQYAYSDKALYEQLSLNRKWRLVEMLNPDAFARFLVLGTGVWLVKDGIITLGTLFMFMGLLNEILIPLHLMSDILPQYSRVARQIDKFLKLMDEPEMVMDPVDPLPLGKVKGRIEFQNVSLQYPGNDEKYILKNVSFVIEPGEHVALVGHSGAGKTTIASLLTRLVDPTEGVILLDGVDIRKYRQEDYRRVLGTVLQDNSLYNQTVAENIAYGRPDASVADIHEAAKKSAAHEFISKLKLGYDTLIGEKGVRLSGGERQRLAIARAILKNPVIVVLDEPTSALDSITEAKVQKGLDELLKGRTAVVIAHRLATVHHSDKILVVHEGEIAAIGKHDELLKISPEYQKMVELQVGGFLAEE